jgi:ligand-binding sensor domain-containing protein
MVNTKTRLKQIKYYIFLLLPFFFAFCNGQNKPENVNNIVPNQPSTALKESDTSISNATTATEIDPNIRSIFQDKNGHYWFGTNAAGVYRYDGKTLLQYTVKDGLSNNQVQNIQEDQLGNIWFGTGVFGVSKFDGRIFTTLTKQENLQLNNGADINWKSAPNDLWFYAGGGVYHYNGHSFVYLPLDKSGFNFKQPKSSPYNLSRFAVYSVLKDKKGNVWFGTQAQGVCRYDGKSFTWFTEKGLEGSAVLGLFEDSNGILWFGNNGAGLFRYDGKSLVNFTEEKRLGNSEFKVSGKSGPGTLARIYAINEDNSGNLWVGTVDAGAWKYDGNNLTNYTTKNGLPSNAINVIYKDRVGELWFGTDGDGICKFNGESFTRFEVK